VLQRQVSGDRSWDDEDILSTPEILAGVTGRETLMIVKNPCPVFLKKTRALFTAKIFSLNASVMHPAGNSLSMKEGTFVPRQVPDIHR
jgi:hypothetical protein